MFNIKRSLELFKALYSGKQISNGKEVLKCPNDGDETRRAATLYELIGRYVDSIDSWTILEDKE